MSHFPAFNRPWYRHWGLNWGTVLAVLSIIAVTQDAPGQTARLSRNSLDAVGLVRSWSTQAAGTRDLHTTLHQSKTRNIHVFDVISDAGTQSYAEGTVGPRGWLMDKAEANRQADIAMRTLKLEGIDATIEPRLVPELTLVLRSDSGQVEAIDAETGRIKWQMTLGPPDRPAYDPAVNDSHVGVVSGSTLYVAEIGTGKLTLQRRIGGIPGGSPVLTDSFAVVPLYRHAMEVLPLDAIEAKRGPSWLTSFGTPTAAPIFADTTLAWPTDRGAVYFADGESGRDLFRVRTRSRIAGQVAFAAPNRFFVGTEDGYLVCVDRRRESVVWDYLLGAPCAGTPYVLDDAVYVVTTERQLHCVDIKLGTQRWIRGGVRATVTGFGNRILARLVSDHLAAVGVDSGQVFARAALPSRAQVIHNVTTDRLYFVEGGRISCYRGRDRQWPTVYGRIGPAAAEEASEKPPTEPTPTEDMSSTENPAETEEGSSEQENPFAEDNPFGGGDSGDDDNPFGSDDGSDEDPFGF